MEIKKSACPYDCPDCCGLLVYTEGDEVIKVKGDPSHSYTRGTLCPKMARYERTVHSSARLTTPLKRVGPKGSGEFTPISWDTARGRKNSPLMGFSTSALSRKAGKRASSSFRKPGV